jgi:formylglycine-generating enzyme required for sulfatase activity
MPVRPSSWLASLLLIALATALLAGPAGAAERRVALVIGNGEYEHMSVLANPAHDARAVAALLQQKGFILVGGGVQLDLTKARMEHAIAELGAYLSDPDTVGLFYYAGHGVSVRERNYLVPVDVAPEQEVDADTDLVDARTVVKAMASAGNKLNMVILDACRSVAFASKTERISKGGLSRMDVPGGMLISFSTQPGNVALDGSGENSPYAMALMNAMSKPGLDEIQVFNDVGVQVKAATGGQQQPWISASPIDTSFYFTTPGEAPGTQMQIVLAPPKPPGGLQDCADCPPLVEVPPGRFAMGSAGGSADERPVHEVSIIRGFALGEYEVTFAEWDACVAAGACSHRPDDRGWGHGRQPVVDVSWDDAEQYVHWLTQRTGKRYRLPTEAEWEYAARAGAPGDDVKPVGIMDCLGCGSRWDNKQPAPVGSFKPNALGLYDMLGNVWEWVADCRTADYLGAPADGAAVEAPDCARRTLRGGSWGDRIQLVRAANRGGTDPGTRSGVIGFRVAREP